MPEWRPGETDPDQPADGPGPVDDFSAADADSLSAGPSIWTSTSHHKSPEAHLLLAEEYVAMSADLFRRIHRENDERGWHGPGHSDDREIAVEYASLGAVQAAIANAGFNARAHAPCPPCPDCPPCPECPPPPLQVHYVWTIGPATDNTGPAPASATTPAADSGGAVNRKGIDAMGSMKDNQHVTLSAQAVDAAGQPVTDTGNRVWTLDRSDIATLTDDGAGGQVLQATGAGLGTVVVSLDDTQADTTDAAGNPVAGQVFHGSYAQDILAGDVAGIDITAGAPADNTPPAPAPGV